MQPTSVLKFFQILEDGAPCHSSRSGKRRRCTSSVFKLPMKLSAIALSKAASVLIGRTDAALFKALAERDRRLMNAAVGMMRHNFVLMEFTL